MLPSEKLRKLISKIYNIDLEVYAWPQDLKDFIFSISLDSDYENDIISMQEVYNKGFNIGHCGLTSRYLAINFEDSFVHIGKCTLLKGTKASLDGNHAWIIINNYLIDPTLMLCIPLEKINELGYSSQKVLAKESACTLPEYDTFSSELQRLEKDKDSFEESLFTISR